MMNQMGKFLALMELSWSQVREREHEQRYWESRRGGMTKRKKEKERITTLIDYNKQVKEIKSVMR